MLRPRPYKTTSAQYWYGSAGIEETAYRHPTATAMTAQKYNIITKVIMESRRQIINSLYKYEHNE